MTARPKPTLTDRYVWAVLRSCPRPSAPELEREVRALVADATEANAADGPLDAAAAERAALAELGDPDALAARYTGPAQHLIGPPVYPAWKRTVSMLLAIVVPIVASACSGPTSSRARPSARPSSPASRPPSRWSSR